MRRVKKVSQPKISSDLLINRELSWLEFNQRVLEEARDSSNPLLERLKFLCIVSSNLDEFFEIRVAGLMQQEQHGVFDSDISGMSATEILQAINNRVEKMVTEQYHCLNSELLPQLRESGIKILRRNELTKSQITWVKRYFDNQVRPVLTPLAINPSHPFPHLLNKSLNFSILLEGTSPFRDDNWIAIVQAPRILPRIIPLPQNSRSTNQDFILLSSVIHLYMNDLFPGMDIKGSYQFRVTRNSDLYFDEEETENLLASIEQELRSRERGAAVRLEVAKGCDEEIKQFLLEQHDLSSRECYMVDGPVNLHRLMALAGMCKRPDLKYTPYTAPVPTAFRGSTDIFQKIRRKNILVHHPYENFSCVVDFLQQAAEDPNVLAIKQTLYRTSGDSPIIEALKKAASHSKQVAAIVELKARFDEEANIQWARELEESGVHVVYGITGLKIHAKMSMVVRREGDHIKRYAHLGTGNYHPSTAKLYTDLGLFTADPAYTQDTANVFDLITGAGHHEIMQKLLVAPFNLHSEIIKLIEFEKNEAKEGKLSRIVIKANSLLDKKIINALYKASQEGVTIDLNIRGICSLKPGLKGVSENITVRSIVGRYLEHARIYYFYHGGEEKIYLGSADLMPRNLYRRIEVVYPVEDPLLQKRLTHEILPAFLNDNRKARIFNEDGTHTPVKRKNNELELNAQEYLMKIAHGKGKKIQLPPITGIPPVKK